MKKVLVITLVLVMALASSAMAAVNFSGSFEAKASMDSFKFTDGYDLDYTPGFTIGASAKNVTVVDEEEIVNWDFSAALTLDNTTFKMGKYKLGLYDNYFDAWVWGNGQELSDKGTHFGLIKAAKKADDIRARVEVPVMDLATVTADFDADTLRAFVTGSVEDINLGLAYKLGNWTAEDPEKPTHVIVAQADTVLPAGDIDVTLKGAAGVTLGDNLGFALGLSADADVTKELNLNGSVTHANTNWAADALTADNTVVKAGATYTEDVFQVAANGTFTIIKDADNTNEITLDAKYRMSDAVTYANLFETDKDAWAKNTAPAFGAGLTFGDMKFEKATVNAASPVLEDMIWVRATGTYNVDKTYNAGVFGHILATDKLTVKPSVNYASTDSTTDVKLVANYKIGLSTTTLNLTAQKVFAPVEADQKELLEASVKVTF